MADATDIRQWLIARAGAWRAMVQDVELLRSQRHATVDEALGAVEAYRGLARDLATARRVAPNTRTTAGLEALYRQLHVLINRRPRGGLAAVRALLAFDIPNATRELRARIVGILSVGILANNIVVSVLAFCAGIFLGLGTLYLIAMNGLMLGAAFAFVHQHGLARALFEFIIAHGPVELSVICIAGATGVALGESIIRPTLDSRRDSFQACAHRVAPVLQFCAVLLVGCGFIEGFISPDNRFPMASRITIGVGYWLIMWALMSGRLFAKKIED